MKPAAVCLPVALALGSVSVMAQAGDPMDRLRACASLSDVERIKCLDLLSREIEPEPARSPSASGADGATMRQDWMVSETTSPIDYSPVVIATATAKGASGGSGMKLSIVCRGGTTSLLLRSHGALIEGDSYAVSYTVDGGSPSTLVATGAPSGTGMAVGGDVVGWLVSLPTEGEIAFRIVGRQNVTLEGRYSLADLKSTRERLALSCKSRPEPRRK